MKCLSKATKSALPSLTIVSAFAELSPPAAKIVPLYLFDDGPRCIISHNGANEDQTELFGNPPLPNAGQAGVVRQGVRQAVSWDANRLEYQPALCATVAYQG
jgi:hypothetical protein